MTSIASAPLRRRLLLALCATAVALLVAAPSTAGTVYAVLASDVTADGIELETQLVVANPLAEPAEITVHFIPAFQNGAERPDDFEARGFVVPAHQTTFLDNLTEGGVRGLLEITTPELVNVSARLVSRTPDGETHWTEIPVVGSKHIFGEDELQVVNGWVRDETWSTSFGMVNLSQSVNNCLVTLIDVEGDEVFPTSSIPVEPLSVSYYYDAVSAAGLADSEDLRVQVSCDGASYSYAIVRDLETGRLITLRPAADGSSILRPPGAAFECPADGYCFEVPGTFLTPTPGDEIVTFPIPAPPETFAAVRVQMEFYHGGWSSADSSGLHGMFWLYRNDTWRSNTFGYTNTRGPGKNIVINLTNVNLPAATTNRTKASVALVPGETYFLDYSYDTNTNTVRTLITRSDGTIVVDMVDATTANRVHIEGGFKIQVGLERQHIEVPTYGWRYSNLVVSFTN